MSTSDDRPERKAPQPVATVGVDSPADEAKTAG